MPAVALGLPALNEEEALKELIPSARALGLLVYVVDDGSTDRTASLAEALGAKVRRHEENRGLGEALRTLLLWAMEELPPESFLATMDADGTMRPEQVPGMVELAEKEGLDVVVASRFGEGAVVLGVPPHRKFLSLMASFLFRLKRPIPGLKDYTCGFRLYRIRALQALLLAHPPLFDAKGASAQVELALRLHALGMRFGEIPIRLDYSRRGRSRLRLLKEMKEYLPLLLSRM